MDTPIQPNTAVNADQLFNQYGRICLQMDMLVGEKQRILNLLMPFIQGQGLQPAK